MKHTEPSSAGVSPCVHLFMESLLDGADALSPGEISLLFQSEAQLTMGVMPVDGTKLEPDVTELANDRQLKL